MEERKEEKGKGRKRVAAFRIRRGNVCKYDGGRITYVKARWSDRKKRGLEKVWKGQKRGKKEELFP